MIWTHRPHLLILLVSMMVAAMLPGQLVVAQPAPDGDATSSGAFCDGSPTADYNGACGPSFTIPNWGDASGWNNDIYADSIQLFDIDGDGMDELIGRSPAGLLVYNWLSEFGQWFPASDLSKSLPFPDNEGWDLPQYGSTISFGNMQTGNFQVGFAIGRAKSGLELWTWYSGTSDPGTGYWTKEIDHGPFADDATNGDWTKPAYYSTIQLGDIDGDGTDELIARASDGIVACFWDSNNRTIDCPWKSNAFSDSVILGVQNPEQYYSTIQLYDIDPATPGLELSGRDSTYGGTFKVFLWESDVPVFNRTWRQWNIWGGPPFGVGNVGWSQPEYYATIQWGHLDNDQQPEVVGRSANGLVWYTVDTDPVACSNFAPCWNDFSTGHIFPDSQGWFDQSSYETIQLADINGDGVDEALGRHITTGISNWFLKQPGMKTPAASDLPPNVADDPVPAHTAGWTNVSGPSLTFGTTDDPLWILPSYYRTVQTGDIDGDGQEELLARGKYGIRTWKFDTVKQRWGRPLTYGFGSFSDARQQAAFELLNNYLNIESGDTIRDSYTSLNTQVAENYQTCLGISIASRATMPPTQTCDLTPPVTTLKNPDTVTAAEWKSMVEFIQQEVALSNDVNGHFNQSVAGILNDLFVYDQATFNQIQLSLFNENHDNTNVRAVFYNLFAELGEAFANLASPETIVLADFLGASIMAIAALQTKQVSTFDRSVANVRTEMSTLAAAANSRNNEFFQYVVQDYGLLHLVGTLVSDQYWLITGEAHDKAVNANALHTATWMYQTILPAIWTLEQDTCGSPASSGGDCPPADDPSALLVGILDHQYQTRYLIHSGTVVNSNSPILRKLFQPIQEDCRLGPGHDGTWSYQDCNLGINRFDLFLMRNGWSFHCTEGTNDCKLDQEFNHIIE